MILEISWMMSVFFFFLFLILKYFNNVQHVMILLLSLESLMLLNLMMICFCFNKMLINQMFFIIYFTLSVMEACVGLSLMIFWSRFYGEEFKENF